MQGSVWRSFSLKAVVVCCSALVIVALCSSCKTKDQTLEQVARRLDRELPKVVDFGGSCWISPRLIRKGEVLQIGCRQRGQTNLFERSWEVSCAGYVMLLSEPPDTSAGNPMRPPGHYREITVFAPSDPDRRCVALFFPDNSSLLSLVTEEGETILDSELGWKSISEILGR